ncbi:MAG TPA: hypothetical protein PLG20_09150 [Candidatus Syntrophosphaera sp.]|jgi:hypothetical protein|nr:hypothetical protein [Candidatus Syntrophosphaera sp.]
MQKVHSPYPMLAFIDRSQRLPKHTPETHPQLPIHDKSLSNNGLMPEIPRSSLFKMIIAHYHVTPGPAAFGTDRNLVNAQKQSKPPEFSSG